MTVVAARIEMRWFSRDAVGAARVSKRPFLLNSLFCSFALYRRRSEPGLAAKIFA